MIFIMCLFQGQNQEGTLQSTGIMAMHSVGGNVPQAQKFQSDSWMEMLVSLSIQSNIFGSEQDILTSWPECSEAVVYIH